MRRIALALLVCLSSAATGPAEENPAAQQEFARGLSAMSRGELDEATRRFEAVLALDPKSFEAHNNLAVIYSEQGKYEAALDQMRQVVKLQPGYYRGRKNLAELYARLAHTAFIDAAGVAPPEEKEQLAMRARLMGAPGARGSAATGTLEAAGVAEPTTAAKAAAPAAKPEAPPAAVAAAPAAAPAATAAPEGSPAEFIALADVPGIALSDAGIRMFRQIGATVQPAERMAVKKGAPLPSAPAFYVAVPGDGRVDMVPLARGEKPFALRDAGGGARDVVVEAQALATMRGAVQAYLTPAVVGATLRPGDATVAQAKRAAVLAAFQGWARAWQGKDLARYVEAYTPDYNPAGGPGHDKWREQRSKVFERSGDLTITLSEPVMLQDGDAVVTLARQEYRSKLQSSTGVKKMTWVLTPQGWKISGEEMLSEKKG